MGASLSHWGRPCVAHPHRPALQRPAEPRPAPARRPSQFAGAAQLARVLEVEHQWVLDHARQLGVCASATVAGAFGSTSLGPGARSPVRMRRRCWPTLRNPRQGGVELCPARRRGPRRSGVWVAKSMCARKFLVNERAMFIIDPDGKVAEVLRTLLAARCSLSAAICGRLGRSSVRGWLTATSEIGALVY
jgi:hypothetical protein